jgi:murein DD-endopeptidase MepM/ murein hydrolase activator NlpD
MLQCARRSTTPRRASAGLSRAPLLILLAAVLTAPVLVAQTSKRPAAAAKKPIPKVEVMPGTLVRLAGEGTRRCAMAGRSWKALDGACYFPIDVLHKPGAVTVTQSDGKRSHAARIVVTESAYGSEDVQLPDIPQAHPSPDDEARNAKEQVRVAALWKRKPGPARFSLPLGNPAKQLPEGKTFGWTRSFNGVPADQPHMGADYAITEGTPVLAAADGTVVLAEEMFYPGNGVIVDHGDSLFTVYYHLSEIQVQPGQDVKKGERLGLVGHTGRATGPHLFFAVRWRNARIDPQFVLMDVEKLPAPE